MECLTFLTFETFQWNLILFTADYRQEVAVLAGRVYNCAVLKWVRLWGVLGRCSFESGSGWLGRYSSPLETGWSGRYSHERVKKVFNFVWSIYNFSEVFYGCVISRETEISRGSYITKAHKLQADVTPQTSTSSPARRHGHAQSWRCKWRRSRCVCLVASARI